MKRALTILALGAALTGCAVGPGPHERITIARDWLGGPDAQGQWKACVAGDRALDSEYRPYLDKHLVVVDGKPHTVQVDTRSQMARNVETSGKARWVNSCMAEAGYTYVPWIDRFYEAVLACDKTTELGSQARQDCLDAHMAASALIDKDKMP